MFAVSVAGNDPAKQEDAHTAWVDQEFLARHADLQPESQCMAGNLLGIQSTAFCRVAYVLLLSAHGLGLLPTLNPVPAERTCA